VPKLLTKYFDLTIPYKNGDEAQQMFLEDLDFMFLYILLRWRSRIDWLIANFFEIVGSPS
jgi:hypothetical protein